MSNCQAVIRVGALIHNSCYSILTTAEVSQQLHFVEILSTTVSFNVCLCRL